MANLFPIFLKLEGRRVLVAGAGPVAEQKLDGLLRAGADVHVVAPQATDLVQQFARDGQLRWSQREFNSSDLDRAALVVAATGHAEVNERIYREAESRGVLCNAVDEPDRCHFYYPAVVQRGDLQIAISTAGHSPALAQRIRKQLEQQFDAGYAEWLNWLGNARRRLFSRPVDPQRRKNILHRIARPEIYERFVRAQQTRRAGVAQ
jgi:precorrin-2 dehydrogenase / sirohydrochlorin ferrochelatase